MERGVAAIAVSEAHYRVMLLSQASEATNKQKTLRACLRCVQLLLRVPKSSSCYRHFRSFVALGTLVINFILLSCKTWTGRFGYLGCGTAPCLWGIVVQVHWYGLGNLHCPDSGVCAQLLASSGKASHNILLAKDYGSP